MSFLKNFGKTMAIYGAARIASNQLEKHLEKKAGGRGGSEETLRLTKEANVKAAKSVAKGALDKPRAQRERIAKYGQMIADGIGKNQLAFDYKLLVYEDFLKKSLKKEYSELSLKERKVILKSRLHLIIDSYYDNDGNIELSEEWYKELVNRSEKTIKEKEAQYKIDKVEKIEFIDMTKEERKEILEAELSLDLDKIKITFHEVSMFQSNLEALLKSDFPELSKSDRDAMLKDRLNRIINHAEKKKDKTLENEEWFKKLLSAVEKGENKPQELIQSENGQVSTDSNTKLKSFISLRIGKVVIAFISTFIILMAFGPDVGAYAILGLLLYSIYLIFDWLIKLIKKR